MDGRDKPAHGGEMVNVFVRFVRFVRFVDNSGRAAVAISPASPV